MDKLSHVVVVVVVIVSGLVNACLSTTPVPQSRPSTPGHTDANGGLLLTPYITSNDPGQVQIARNLSAVRPFPQFPDVTSYAGYITVDQATDSNLFFTFVLATDDTHNAPVLLEMNGGPGLTSLPILFYGFGPFSVNSDQKLVENECTPNKKFNVIYLDVPAGGGYSYTKSYPRSDSEVGKQIHTFLLQFFTLFDEYSANDIYIVGESYAAKFAVEAGLSIIKNKGKDPIRINFKGIVTLSGFVDPPKMVKIADTLYYDGLINEVQRSFLSKQIDIALALLPSNKLAATIITLITGSQIVPTFVGKIAPDYPVNSSEFIKTDDFRARFHIGNHSAFPPDDATVLPIQLALVDTLLSPSTTGVETLLNNSYKVCLINGQRDHLVTPVSVSQFVTGLRWHGAAAYNATPRLIWTAPGDPVVSGYVTQVSNMWEIMVSNAGHGVLIDQSCNARDAIDICINNKKFPGTTPVIPPIIYPLSTVLSKLVDSFTQFIT